jgi:hypothetical protein
MSTGTRELFIPRPGGDPIEHEIVVYVTYNSMSNPRVTNEIHHYFHLIYIFNHWMNLNDAIYHEGAGIFCFADDDETGVWLRIEGAPTRSSVVVSSEGEFEATCWRSASQNGAWEVFEVLPRIQNSVVIPVLKKKNWKRDGF